MGWLDSMFGSKNDDSARVKQLVAEGAKVIDVRTPEEYAGGHVQGAVNIPVQVLAQRVAEVGPKDKPVVVYCRSGGRSASAAGFLRQQGYEVIDVGPMSAFPA